MKNGQIDTIIFDLGGVLVDWNPEYLYLKIFDQDQEKTNWFLNQICTNDWNMEQDAGRTLAEATQILLNQHPEHEEWIKAFYDRWEEMIHGDIPGTVLILDELKRLNQQKLYALTNWSAETFPIAEERFPFLNNFEGIVVSGLEKTRKPFPEIYEILLKRYGLDPSKSVFIDDNKENIVAAESLGIHGIHFINPNQLRKELILLNVLN